MLAVAVVLAVLVGAGAASMFSRTTPGPQAAGDRPPVAAEPQRIDERIPPGQQAPLPDATLEGFAGGEPVATTDLVGAPLVVNFWATWCPPCVEEMPAFQEVASTSEGVTFLGVNVQDNPTAAQAFVTDLGITYRLASDPAGAFYTEVRGFGMPTTLFVDPAGTIVFRHTGPLTAEELRALLRDHLDVGS